MDLSIVPLLQSETKLPVVVDISHAAGRTDILNKLARASLAVGANGIMVEVHPDPKSALSDPLQQLDFHQFSNLVNQL